MTPPLISVVIPVYRAEKMLDELYTRLRDAIETVSPHFEIVLVEDCGPDRSWDVIERLAAADPRVVGLQFSRNFGQHYGITAGLDICRGDWVVVMDCDLQDAPEEIPRLYAKAQEGYDVVLALRGARSDPLLKRATSWLFYRIFSYLADIDFDGDSGNFRIMSRKVVKNFTKMREQLRFFGGHVQWMGFPTTGIRVQHAERLEGTSSYTFAKLFKLAADTIIAYSDKPLRMAARLGLTMAGISFLLGSFILGRSLLQGSPVPGWSSLIISLYFIGGLIIGILGIIGIYLGKAFDEAKKRPLYIVRRLTSNAGTLDD
ncbi:dolichol-phosphate mannosyltransferase [Pseudoduganella lurida]|uniref:Dolichol-phosphate mannosyltransferase n=1 Tax=Pseudoduganella lurida TaxID=1036180 RepID=A0A562R6X9_9BURK|nr:glycosyltransferase family 2 protein [Pseudoduganella lurida]TWI64324.1 dolichol-phosphate mannosyltransferase [Pseudoduganella lurida]